MAVPESSPYKNVKEFVEAWKAGKVKNYASLGPGTSAHLIAERMKTLTGLDLKHIPFPPGPQAPLALGRGEIDMMFYGLASFQPGLQAKTIRLIGIAMPQRSALTPDLPTLREQGYDGIIQAWYGVCAPKGTPKAIVDKLAKAIIDTVNDPEIVKKLNARRHRCGAVEVGGRFRQVHRRRAQALQGNGRKGRYSQDLKSDLLRRAVRRIARRRSSASNAGCGTFAAGVEKQ